MADRINIADKETLDLALTRVTTALSDLQSILSKLGTNEDTSVETLFGLTKLVSVVAGTSVIKSIHRGYITVGGGVTATATHPTVAVDKSVVIFNASPAGSAVDHGVHMTSRSSTSIGFSARQAAYVTWQIIEFN